MTDENVEISHDAGGFGGNGSVMTVEQAAHRIGVSPRTVRRLVSQRRVTHLRVGRIIRLRSEDVDDLVKRCVVEAVV
jgi:excisionase family DNA binding protein